MNPRNSQTDDDSDSDKYALLDRLAAEFAARYRQGERPALKEYADRHPELAEEIHDIFPAMVDLEHAEEIRQDQSGPEPAEQAPALSLVGDFRILRQVGRGGMGVVYEAEQISLGRRVALKVLPGGALRDPKTLERFRREARAAARLHHTNIVPVFEVGEVGDVVYYTMQFIQGESLDLVIDELKRLRTFSDPRAVNRASGPDMSALRSTAGRHTIGCDKADAVAGSGRRAGVLPVSQIAHSLLTGKSAIEPPTTMQSPPLSAAAGPDGIGDPGDARDKTIAKPAAAIDQTAWGSGSAVMPGGKQISTFESSGTRQQFFRSVAEIGRQAADALAYAHTRNVVHRDVKPSNILLDTAGCVWITDFGLAKADESGLTATGDLLGTLRYMAPERLRGAGDGRADVYALGLTLYELLTLRPAFDAADRLRLVEQIKEQDPPRPRAVDSRIERDLETLVLKAIDKDPRRRYQTAGEMAEDLRRFLVGEPIRARQVGELERAWKWAMRRKAIAGLLLLAVVSLLAGTVVSMVFSWRAQHYAALADARAREAHAAALHAARVAADSRAASAIATAEAGDVDRGLYGLIDALELAPPGGADDRQRRDALGRNISAWMGVLPVLRHTIDGATPKTRLLFTGPDRTVATLVHGKQVRRFEMATGKWRGDSEGMEFPAPVLTVSPDGRQVVTAAPIPGRKQPACVVSIFDAGSGAQRAQLPIVEGKEVDPHVTFDPSGRYLGLKFPVPHRDGPGGEYLRRFWRLDTCTEVLAAPRIIDDHTFSMVRLVTVRGGHTAIVYPERRSRAMGRAIERLRFWDLDLERPLDRLEPEQTASTTRSVAVNGGYTDSAFDGTSLVFANGDGVVSWWSAASGLPTRPEWHSHRATSAATLLEDGRMLAVRCDDSRVRYFDLASGQNCGAAPLLRGSRVAISPQGAFLLAQRGDSFAVWQVPGPPRLPHPSKLDYSGPVFHELAVAADGKEFAVGAAQSNGSTMGRDNLGSLIKFDFWNSGLGSGERRATEDGRPLGAPLNPFNSQLCYSRDGRLVAASRTQARKHGTHESVTVAVWERADGRRVMPWTLIPDFIHSAAFSPDARTLAVGTVSGIWLIEVSSGQRARHLSQPGPVARLAFSADGRRLAGGARTGWGSESGMQLWDVSSGNSVGEFIVTGSLPYFDFTPGDHALLVVDRSARRLSRIDPATGGQLGAAIALSGEDAGDSVADHAESSPPTLTCALRADGAAIAESATSSVARQYDVLTGRPIGPTMNHDDTIGWLTYSPDGTTLVSACAHGTVRLWDAATGTALGPPLAHGLPVLGCWFSLDSGRFSVVTVDGRLTSWPVPRSPVDVNPASLRHSVEAVAGLRSVEGGGVSDVKLDAWRERRSRSPDQPEERDAESRRVLARWHGERADNARRSGDRAAYRHHLGRVGTLDPKDWLAVADRAASFVEAGQPGEAGPDLALAQLRANPADLTAWSWARAIENLILRRPDAALWFIDRVVAAEPRNWTAYAHRAAVFERLNRSSEAAAEYRRAAALGADPRFIAEAARDCAFSGECEAAQWLSSLAFGLNACGPQELAVISLLGRDNTLYRRACAAMLHSVRPGAPQPPSVFEAVWLIGLGPDGVDDYRSLLVLVESELAGLATSNAPDQQKRELYHLLIRSRAAILIRSGRPDLALPELDRVRAFDAFDPYAELLRLIALLRAGKTAEARARKPGALAEIDAYFRYDRTWYERLMLAVLQNEAESLFMDADLPAKPFAAP
jgi:eukaryotic-like serine/threonine-protein kinase